jgi:hypothetical protein
MTDIQPKDETSNIEELIKKMSPEEALKNFGVFGMRTKLMQWGFDEGEINDEIRSKRSNEYGSPSTVSPLTVVDCLIADINEKLKNSDISKKYRDGLANKIKEYLSMKKGYGNGNIEPVRSLLEELRSKSAIAFSQAMNSLIPVNKPAHIDGHFPKNFFATETQFVQSVDARRAVNFAVQNASISRAFTQIPPPQTPS